MCNTIVAVTVCLLLWPAAVGAQSVEKIIDRHIEAVGGEKALERIRSTSLTGVVLSDDGRKGRFSRQSKRPNLLSVEMSWGDQRWSTNFNGRSAWERLDDGPLRTLSGASAARARGGAIDVNDRVLKSASPRRILLQGRDHVRGRPVFVLVATSPDGFRRTLFVDAESYLIVKEEHQSEAGPDVRIFDDYRRIDEVMEPHRIEWQRGTQRFVVTIERVTHNAIPDERPFQFAESGATPLKAADLLDAVRRNQQQLEDRLQSYAYLQTRIEREIDDNGAIKKEDVRVFEVFYLAGQAVRKLVKQNGQALSPNNRRREDERVDAIVRDYEERRARQAQRGDPGRRVVPDVGSRQPPSEDRWISAYLRMSELSNPRRENVSGRPVIVVEFQPRPRKFDVESDFDVKLPQPKP